MSMFDFLGIKTAVTATSGAALGAGLTHLYHKFTTGKKLKSLEERLGNTDEESNQRAVKKVAILKALAYRDDDFDCKEQIFIYHYILGSPDLSNDLKVALALELAEPPPTKISTIWQKVQSMVKFSDLFQSEEEASGFIHTLLNLANADGHIDSSEIAYIKQVCMDCKVPPHLFPEKLQGI
jgi:tellurite resistance protein